MRGNFSQFGIQTRRDANCERGIALPLFAIMFAAMLAFLGLVYDGGRIYFEKRRMQVAADAGAIGGAYELMRENDEQTIIDGGRDDAALNSFIHGADGAQVLIKHPPDSGSRAGDIGCVECEITQPFPTTLMRVAGHDSADVATRAVACVEAWNNPMCVLSLYCGGDETGLEFNGNGQLNAPDCDVVVNSYSEDAVVMNGTGSGSCPDMILGDSGRLSYGYEDGLVSNGSTSCIEGGEHFYAKGCSLDPYCSLPAEHPDYTSSCQPPDPALPTDPAMIFDLPTIDDTNYNDPNVFPSCVVTPTDVPCFDGTALQLPAGYYRAGTVIDPDTGEESQGIRVNGGVVNLQCGTPLDDADGCIFFTDQLRTNGGDITGQNLMVYATNALKNSNPNNPGAHIDISANTTINLSAPFEGDYKNIVLFGQRDPNLPGMECLVGGDADSCIEGGVYCPSGFTSFGGSSGCNADQLFSFIIGYQIEFHGTPQVGVNYTGTGRTSSFTRVNMVE